MVRTADGHRLSGAGQITEVADAYLDHFLDQKGASMDDVVPTDVFDHLDWQARVRRTPVPSTAGRRGFVLGPNGPPNPALVAKMGLSGSL